MKPTKIPTFSAPYAQDDTVLAAQLLADGPKEAERERKVDEIGGRLIAAIRNKGSSFGGIEELLREYAISTKEGLALMVLAEALLRVPEAQTADRLIEDKLGQGDFGHHETKSNVFLVNASAWALGITAKIIQPGETPEGVVGQLAKRMGLPAVRTATRQAMRFLGNHFVLGQTIDEALERARSSSGRLFRYSFDMLGEGARTADDAKRYFDSYAAAIGAIGRAAGNDSLPNRPGISVKLSALHPRYDALSRERVLRELVPEVIALAAKAKSHDLNFTIDAEEADRLELSLEVIAAVFADSTLDGWDGFGLAIQAYQKRALAAIDWIAALAQTHQRRMMVRLVKGAYWDTEIKRAQERGLDDYPVFTRKAMTDLNYAACADKLLALRPLIFPQFATHNALTVASIIAQASQGDGYEFQRLHGMGEALYSTVIGDFPKIACRTYAPVGGHQDLLAYLVRRLLENGANSSFVSVSADPNIPAAQLLRRPSAIVGNAKAARHPKLPLPRDLYGAQRKNSRGLELGHRDTLNDLLRDIQKAGQKPAKTAPLIDGIVAGGDARTTFSPIDECPIGQLIEADVDAVDRAMDVARRGFFAWNATPADRRASILEHAADAMEKEQSRLIHLLQAEGGKTIDDAISEIREAVDFCRYYAAEGRKLFGRSIAMHGPTGESNQLALRGRGVFVAISPWNFPLAIFVGQIAAALMAGNSVVAKPAEQTPLIAGEAIAILHNAGIPTSALQLLPGDGHIGAKLVSHDGVDGVVFTGSTDVARLINRTLAAKDAPIVPLIAETGGINTMIVDATALPEQVADDVVTSAFRSAGQRCSALRLLCVQEDVASRMIDMIKGAAHELKVGDPRDVSTHVGPIIDQEAKDRLQNYIAAMKKTSRVHYAGSAPEKGYFVAPHIFELARPELLDKEVFGPILHVVRYKTADLDDILNKIDKSGYGLTLGIHSRINGLVDQVVSRLSVGNIYVNRNMIGAVVGVQPFGGHGLSGTGPKAGGPNYLTRFATEQTISVNLAAAGGNATLIAMEE